jgi:uncharacterized protein YggE
VSAARAKCAPSRIERPSRSGVESRKPKPEDARAAVAKTVDVVLKLTRDLQIDPELVRPRASTCSPNTTGARTTRTSGRSSATTFRGRSKSSYDLEKLGQLLERATDLGVNQMGDPRLIRAAPGSVREALAKAVVDAPERGSHR